MRSNILSEVRYIVLSLIRYIAGLLKKEHILRHNYHRTHPHFLWYVLLDAVLSIGLVFGGFAIVHGIFGPSKAQIENEDAGAIPLTAERLFAHLQGEKRVAYWIGPKEGYSYSPTGVEKDFVTITYLKGGESALFNITVPNLTIQTFEDESAFNDHGPRFFSPDRTSTWNLRGDEVDYDPNLMTSVVVRFKNQIQVVQINYPSARSAATMLSDSMSLRRVW